MSFSEPVISMVLPTRKRPRSAKNFLSSLKQNCKKPHLVEIIICVDVDDQSYDNFKLIFETTKIIKRERRGLGSIIFGGIQASTGDIIFLCNDDVSVETLGWDEEIRKIHNLYPDGIYIFSPNDLNKQKNLFVFPGFGRKVAEILYNYPKRYRGAFMDNHLNEVFESLKFHGHDRLIYLENIIFRHEHYRVTGQKPDSTYLERDRFGDDLEFFSSVENRKKECERLLAHINGHGNADQPPEIKNTIKNGISIYLFKSYLPLKVSLKTLIYMFSRYCYKKFIYQK